MWKGVVLFAMGGGGGGGVNNTAMRLEVQWQFGERNPKTYLEA